MQFALAEMQDNNGVSESLWDIDVCLQKMLNDAITPQSLIVLIVLAAYQKIAYNAVLRCQFIFRCLSGDQQTSKSNET